MANEASDLSVTVCGGGHASHILIGMLRPRVGEGKLGLFAPFQDEAKKWQESPGVTVCMKGNDMPLAKPDRVSKEAADVVPQADLLILPIPGFAMEPTLRAIAPHLKKGAMVGALPGNGGFHWLAQHILYVECGRRDVCIWGSNQLPLNCRWTEYARKAMCLTTKDLIKVSARPLERGTQLAQALNTLLAPIHFGVVKRPITLNLYPSNQVIHSARLYDLFGEYKPGDSYPENPTFYESMTPQTMQHMQDVSDDLSRIVAALEKHTKGFAEGFDPIYEAMKGYYKSSIEDDSSLLTCFTTNRGYTALTTPMKQREDGRWVPDFSSRYFTEDIPFGLCLAKGVAEMAGVDTPTIDKFIAWAQVHLGKEYLVDGKLTGKDALETASPRHFGLNTLEELLNGEPKKIYYIY